MTQDPKSGPPSRRNTLRMQAVVPPSSRGGADSETSGRIHRMVAWLDDKKGGFFISRLISQLGINLRSFAADSRDDPRVLSKMWPLLDVMLSADERDALLRAMREGGPQSG